MGDIEMRPANSGMDTVMAEEQPPENAPSNLPATIKYFDSVKAKLNKRHDKELIRREESLLYEKISSLPELEIQRLDDVLTLVPTKVSEAPVPQQAAIGGALPTEFPAQFRIRLMSSHIHEVLKANPTLNRIELDIEPYFLNIIIQYCELYNYIKVMSTI